MKDNKLVLGGVIWFLGSIFFLAEYFIRVSTGVLSVSLFNEFNASATSIGLLSAYFYYSYISMQIPVGILVDHFSVKYLLSFATIIFGISCLLFSTMKIIEVGYIARFIMGLVGAFAFVGTLKLITIYFSSDKFALLSGITQGMGMLGAVIGTAPMAYLFAHINWRVGFIYFAIIFISLGIVMLLLVKNTKTSGYDESKSKLGLDLILVLRSRQTWLNCLFIGLMYAPTEVFGEEWGIMFVQFNNHLNTEKSALVVGFIFIGMVIGCPLLGYISDRLKSRIKIMRVCALSCLILIIFIIYGKLFSPDFNYLILTSIMFIYGVFAAAIIPSYAVASEIHSRKVAGIALGVTNMATVIIGALFIPLIGKILDYMMKLNYRINSIGIERYHLSDFYIAFSLLPLCFILCFVLTFFIKDTQQKLIT